MIIPRRLFVLFLLVVLFSTIMTPSLVAQRRPGQRLPPTSTTPPATLSISPSSIGSRVSWAGFHMKAGALLVGYEVFSDHHKKLIPSFSYVITPQHDGWNDNADLWNEPVPADVSGFEVDVTGTQTFSVFTPVSPEHPLKVDDSTEGMLFLPSVFSPFAVASLNGAQVSIVGGWIKVPSSLLTVVLAVCDGNPSQCLSWASTPSSATANSATAAIAQTHVRVGVHKLTKPTD